MLILESSNSATLTEELGILTLDPRADLREEGKSGKLAANPSPSIPMPDVTRTGMHLCVLLSRLADFTSYLPKFLCQLH